MFRRISVARRYLFAVGDTQALRVFLRYFLRVVSVSSSALISLVLLCVLYTTAEHKFLDWLGWVWEPSYPPSWRVLFLSLFVVPAFSFLQLVWLCLHHLICARNWWRRGWVSPSRQSQGYSMLQRNESSLPEEGGLSGIRDDEDGDLGHHEGGVEAPRFHASFQKQVLSYLSSFMLSPRFIFWFSLLCTSLWFGLHYQQPADIRHLPAIEKANAHPKRAGYGNQGKYNSQSLLCPWCSDRSAEKIFIAAMFYNNEEVLPYWSDSIIQVIHHLGADNVFVSILESGSDDQSPALLRQLDDRLGAMHVERRILIQDEAIQKPYNLVGNNRIYYLSALRNHVLEPLVENGGYDKVIFSNDIFVEPETILELLYTADGEYDMACGLDYGSYG